MVTTKCVECDAQMIDGECYACSMEERRIEDRERAVEGAIRAKEDAGEVRS